MSPLQRFVDDRSGASELIGYVLLVGIIFLAALLIVVYGSSLIQDAQSEVNQQSAQLVVQELDSKLSTLASLSDVTRVRFDLGETAPDDLSVVQQGFINITVNRNVSHTTVPDCQTQVNLTSIRYRGEGEQVIGYEAGGVWRGDPGGGTVMVTSPDVRFRNGSLDVTVVNLTGRITENTNEAILQVERSADLTRRKTNTVLSGECVRPDNVTVKINNSAFYRAWGAYLRDEIGHARVFESNQTVLSYIPQSELAQTANDFRNNVVNLSQDNPPRYMRVDENGNPIPGAILEANPANSVPAHISVDKEAGNTYTVQYRPLGNATTFPISNRTTVVRSLSETGVATDAVFVIDDSGSMTNIYGSTGETRLYQAKRAAAGSLPVLNGSDRVGIVGYDDSAVIMRPEDENGVSQLLTTNAGEDWTSATPTGANESIDNLNAGGSTCIYCGLSAALQTLGTASNQTRNQTVILLTDGQNNVYSDDEVENLARRAAARNITVYTVRIGGTDTGLLENIADITGGRYKNTRDPAELREFFRRSLQSTVTQTQIRRTAMSTNATSMSVSGTRHIYEPYVAGDTDGMAMARNQFMNINDPMAPSNARHSFAVEDGFTVYLNASWYGCGDNTDDDGDGEDERNWTLTPFSENGYTVARCTDPNEDNVHNISDRNITIYTDGYVAGRNRTGNNDWGGDPDDWPGNIPGNPAATNPPLLAERSPPWHENMTQQLEGFLETDTATIGGTQYTLWRLDLDSNEAVVVYNYSMEDYRDRSNVLPEWNRMALLYEIGLSEQEAQPEGIVNIRVRQVRMAEGT